ncbi:helix-turn-helix domain-containing protein [bacterium]|nr:helix-turn-helix domain-containing protein [bacterium]
MNTKLFASCKSELNFVNFFKFDKSIVTEKVWAKLPSASKTIYPVIGTFANKQGMAFPGVDTIAQVSGVCEKTVRTGVKSLVLPDHLEIKKKPNKRGHYQFFYTFKSTPESKTGFFGFNKVIVQGQNWSLASQAAHAVYITMRAFDSVNPYLYEEIEEDSCFKLPKEDDKLIKACSKQYAFCDAEREVLAEYSGINPRCLSSALKSLEEHFLIKCFKSNENDFNGWIVYRTPPGFFPAK